MALERGHFNLKTRHALLFFCTCNTNFGGKTFSLTMGSSSKGPLDPLLIVTCCAEDPLGFYLVQDQGLLEVAVGSETRLGADAPAEDTAIVKP